MKKPSRSKSKHGKKGASAHKSGTKSKTQTLTVKASPALTELLGKALTDKEFRARLATEQKAATSGFNLTKSDLKVLNRITPDQLEEQAKRLAGRVGLMIKIVITKRF